MKEKQTAADKLVLTGLFAGGRERRRRGRRMGVGCSTIVIKRSKNRVVCCDIKGKKKSKLSKK